MLEFILYLKQRPNFNFVIALFLNNFDEAIFILKKGKPRQVTKVNVDLKLVEKLHGVGTLYFIDNINNIKIEKQKKPVILKGAKTVVIRGWAVDSEAKDEAGGVYIDIDGKFYPSLYGFNRADVAEAYHVSSYQYSGFEGDILVSEIGNGLHKLSLKILTKNKKSYYSPEQTFLFEL